VASRRYPVRYRRSVVRSQPALHAAVDTNVYTARVPSQPARAPMRRNQKLRSRENCTRLARAAAIMTTKRGTASEY